jgi:hypothetical protein
MDFEQAHPRASVVCPNRGRCTKGHFVDVTEMVPRSKKLGPRRRNVKCAGGPYRRRISVGAANSRAYNT